MNAPVCRRWNYVWQSQPAVALSRNDFRIRRPQIRYLQVTDTPAPTIRSVYACVKLLNKVMLTQGGGVSLTKAA